MGLRVTGRTWSWTARTPATRDDIRAFDQGRQVRTRNRTWDGYMVGAGDDQRTKRMNYARALRNLRRYFSTVQVLDVEGVYYSRWLTARSTRTIPYKRSPTWNP